MAYATREQLYVYLPQLAASATAETDAQLDSILERATDIVRQFLRMALADHTFDYAPYGAPSARRVRSVGGPWLFIPPHQPGSVSAITYLVSGAPLAGVWDEDAATTALYRVSGWGYTDYRITAVWGYGPTPPDSIIEVTLELAVNLWRSKDKGMFTDTIGVDGSGAVQYIGGLTNQQRMLLMNVVNTITLQRGVAV